MLLPSIAFLFLLPLTFLFILSLLINCCSILMSYGSK
nr:MAG TPA: hypothetical protein [Bacteriophage sp.]